MKLCSLCPLSCRLGGRQDFQPWAAYNCGNPQLRHLPKAKSSSSWLCPIHSPSQTPDIHSYHSPSPLLPWYPNLFFLNSLSRYQSISSTAYRPSDYQQFYHSTFFSHGRTTGEYLHQSFCLPSSSSHITPYPCILLIPSKSLRLSICHIHSPNSSSLLLLP